MRYEKFDPSEFDICSPEYGLMGYICEPCPANCETCISNELDVFICTLCLPTYHIREYGLSCRTLCTETDINARNCAAPLYVDI